ncbi:MAG: type II secretion system protein [Nitrospirota bacterium]|nr:type II secretion system protein [Nitrospirota bacterium]
MKNAKIKEVPVISVCVRKKLTLLTDTVTAVFKSRRDGITLIEMVLGMVLMGIVALVVANALSTGITGFFVVDNRKEALDQARIAMDRMAKEIRNLKSSTDVGADSSASQFCFKAINNLSDNDTTNDDTIISYRYSVNTIIRQDGLAVLGNCPGVAGNTLATNIAATFSFAYIQANGTVDSTFSSVTTERIRIIIPSTVSGETVELQTEVWPRNL